jgi:uncharacterized protein
VPSIPLDVRALFAETGASERFDGEVEAPGLDLGPVSFSFTEPVSVHVSLDNAGGLVVLHGSASVDARVDCVRCLEPFDLPLDAAIEAYYTLPGGEEGLPEEQDHEVIEGDTVDVWPAVLAALAEAAPFAPVHDAECKGICASCGADLNVEDCDCETVAPESPFAVLKDVFEASDGETDAHEPAASTDESPAEQDPRE